MNQKRRNKKNYLDENFSDLEDNGSSDMSNESFSFDSFNTNDSNSSNSSKSSKLSNRSDNHPDPIVPMKLKTPIIAR